MSTDSVTKRDGAKTLRKRAVDVARWWYGNSLDNASRIHGLAGEIEMALKEALAEHSEEIQVDGWLSPVEAEGLRQQLAELERCIQEDTFCAYCGHAYPKGTPKFGGDALTEHIKVCPKHPMRECERKLKGSQAALRRAMAELRECRKGAILEVSNAKD